MLINRALFVSQMMPLFSRTNPAYLQISLKKIYAILQILKKFNETAWWSIKKLTKKTENGGKNKEFCENIYAPIHK